MTQSKPTKKGKRSRLVILDAHAILHRAYHAIPDLTSSKGEPTGALYGLSNMIMRIATELNPDYVVACTDLPDKTHRHAVYEGYKGTRAEVDTGLVVQLGRAPHVFNAFAIPVVAVPGFEADDCVGTIVHMLRDRDDVEIIIATGDHDTLQLVSGDRVKVFTLRSGITETILFNEERVRERYGFGPEHIVDYKGLRGDPSDNIKGVAGIGEKTATELITHFGSIENMYRTLAEDPDAFVRAGIKPRVVNLLREGEKDARFSKELATIHTGAPITFALPDHAWRETIALSTVLSLFDELEFRSIADRARHVFGEAHETPTIAPADADEVVDEQRVAEASIALWLLHSDMTNPTREDVRRYAGANTFAEAYTKVMQELTDTGRLGELFETIEKPLISVVSRMCRTGITLDVPYLGELSHEFHTELGELELRIFQHVGHEFNINSPRQLASVIYDELGIGNGGRIKKTATGQRSTREEELDKLRDEHPIITDVLKYREHQKMLSTYVDALPALVHDDGRLHTTFLQAGTTTGRMASKDPNLQNIPIKDGIRVRRAFVARDGALLVGLDYAQIELRIAAGLSGDTKLVETFVKGEDIHTRVASEVFGVAPSAVTSDMRRRAKVINFGILYGMGANALRVNLGDGVTIDEARRYLTDYFDTFAGLASYVEGVKQTAAHTGFTETLFGRRRYFAGLESSAPQVRAAAERMAVNAPIQGTQADIIKKAMVDADTFIEKKKWRGKVELVMQIHDELVYEVDASLAEEVARDIASIMERVVTPDALNGVPITVSYGIGKNFGDIKK